MRVAEAARADALIADALVLVMTPGMSLAAWKRLGLLDREWALYARLSPSFGRIVVAGWGGSDDAGIASALGSKVTVVASDASAPDEAHDPRLPRLVADALAGARTALVKTNQMEAGPAAVRIAAHLRRAGVRTGLFARGGFLWSRFVAAEHGSGSPQSARAGRIESELCRAADVVVGTTPDMVDDLAWRYGLPRERCMVVPNYVIDDAPTPRPDRDGDTVLYAGQLVERKRVDLLIRAMDRLPEPRRSRARLSIIGDGPEEPRLRALADEMGVRVSFEKRLPHIQLIDRMSRCALYAQASRLEGHPKTVIEAMATGAPVVVAEGPGLDGVVDHGLTGMCVPGTASALAGAIDALLGDREWRDALGAAAASAARARWGLDRIIGMEWEAARAAMERCGSGGATAPVDVTWDATLLDATTDTQVTAWARSMRGFARRLEPTPRALFLAGIDVSLYELQGRAAIDAEGGLHPKHRLTRYHDFFVERIRPGDRVLDLGCGVGALAASIAERSGARVTGMDWSADNLDKARARASAGSASERLSFIAGDITRDRADGVFDVIVLSNILEHLRERPALLAAWREWYGARRFLLRVPAFDREWRVPWKRELGVEWRLDPTHETEYTHDQLRAELAEGGMRITESIARWGEYWLAAEPT